MNENERLSERARERESQMECEWKTLLASIQKALSNTN